MLKISLNETEIFISEKISLHDFLKIYVKKSPFSIAINRKFISRHKYMEIILQDHDVIEIISPMQGG